MSCEDNKEHENYCKHCATCHDCLDEGRAREAGTITQLQSRNDELEAELAILKAENDNWRSHGASLNEIKAKAVEDAKEMCVLSYHAPTDGYMDGYEQAVEDYDEHLTNYAKQLRGE